MKQMYVTKQKQTHRFRKQASGYQWEMEEGGTKDGGMERRGTNY